MSKLLILGFFLFSGFIFGQTTLYKGVWFDIKYPSDFKVKPSLKLYANENEDAAWFVSPDGSVEFFVHSPQWSGTVNLLEPTDQEKLAGKSTEKSGEATTTWITIAAKNGSYTRSYVLTTTESTSKVLGIKYKDQKSYDLYKQKYIDFKKSLIQYAD